MISIIKVIKYEMLISKQYIKVLAFLAIMGIFLSVSSKNFLNGIITIMTLVSIKNVVLIFQCEEKSNMKNFYGFIPVKRKHLVVGRFCFCFLIGILFLLTSVLINSIVFNFFNISVGKMDYFLALVFGYTIYLLNISIQTPFLYKLGSVKGAIFAYVPVLFFILFFYLIGGFSNFGVETASIFLDNIVGISIGILLASIVAVFISVKASESIFSKII